MFSVACWSEQQLFQSVVVGIVALAPSLSYCFVVQKLSLGNPFRVGLESWIGLQPFRNARMHLRLLLRLRGTRSLNRFVVSVGLRCLHLGKSSLHRILCGDFLRPLLLKLRRCGMLHRRRGLSSARSRRRHNRRVIVRTIFFSEGGHWSSHLILFCQLKRPCWFRTPAARLYWSA